MKGFPGVRTWGERSPLPGVLAAAFLASPVVVGLVYVSLGAVGLVGPGANEGGISLGRVARVLAEPAVWEGTLWTLWVAGASTVLSVLAAAGVAVVFRGRGWTSRLGRIFAFLPLPVPHLAAGVGGLLVLGQSGILGRIGFQLGWIGVPSDMPVLVMDSLGFGLMVALTWKEIPFLSLVAVSVLETRGEGLEDAARDLGAGLFDVLSRVTWPLLWRGMLPAALAVFTFVVGSYEAAVLLAPSDPLALPLMTWERYTDAALTMRADAYVLSLLSLVLVMVAVAVHEWMRVRLDGDSGS